MTVRRHPWAFAPVVPVLLCCLMAAQSIGQAQAPSPRADDPSGVTGRPESRPTPRNLERWMHNPRERTLAAIKALEQERPEEAVEAASTARRLDPAQPMGAFNEGTVRLLAGDATGAQEALEVAAGADSELAAAAAYNLGNAYYESRQTDRAIAAYEASLRRDPEQPATKINLELALREQQRQQQEQQQQGRREEERESQTETGEEEQNPDQTSESGEPEDRPGDEQSPLPRFEPRPDMTAEEAASLLEAVEAMEREARAALQPEARRAAPGNRDW